MKKTKALFSVLACAVGLIAVPTTSAGAKVPVTSYKCSTIAQSQIKVCVQYDYFDGKPGYAGIGWAFRAEVSSTRTLGSVKLNMSNGLKSPMWDVHKTGNVSHYHPMDVYHKASKNGYACAGIQYGGGYYSIGKVCINA